MIEDLEEDTYTYHYWEYVKNELQKI